MPDGIVVHPVDTSTERKIITALIVSTKFCAQIIPILRPEYIEVDYVKIVVRWVTNYYNKYKKAPANHIQDLFEQNKKRLKPAIVEIIEGFLTKLSENYLLDNIETESFNSDYYIDLAYEHFRERSLQLHLAIVNSLLEQGKRKEAGEEVEKFRQLQKDIYPYETLTPEVVERVLLRREAKPLLTFPGKLGDLIGNVDRGWLVGFLAPTKRGKSWVLLETAFQSVISGAKCLFISLEMSADEVWDRFIKRITSCGEREGNVFYPVFDCLRNQDGSCTIKNRINKVKLLKDGMFKPEPGKEPIGYKPCAICRTDYTGSKNHPYIPETWFEGIKRERLDYAMALKKISGINRMYNMNKIFRVLTFPAHTMNITKMEVYLKQWEDNDGWIPDVIIIDYADILAPEDNRETGRDRIDNTWQELKRTSSSRRCVLATASQANRASFEKFIVKQIHTSEDIRKIAHGDLWIALNQTPWEKKAGVIRFGVIAHRHKEFLETESVTVLQNLSQGQVVLDSEWGVVESFMERKKD